MQKMKSRLDTRYVGFDALLGDGSVRRVSFKLEESDIPFRDTARGGIDNLYNSIKAGRALSMGSRFEGENLLWVEVGAMQEVMSSGRGAVAFTFRSDPAYMFGRLASVLALVGFAETVRYCNVATNVRVRREYSNRLVVLVDYDNGRYSPSLPFACIEF